MRKFKLRFGGIIMDANNTSTVDKKSFIRRYAKYVLGLVEPKPIIIIPGEDFDWKNFIDNLFKNPSFVFLTGSRENIEKEIKDGVNNIKDFKYFYDIFPEICAYIPAPFKPSCLNRLDKGVLDKVQSLISELRNTYYNIKSKIKGRKFPKNFSEFLKDAGDYFGAGVEERERVSHGKSKEKQGLRKLKIQIANLLAGIARMKLMKLRQNENKNENKIKVLLIDNNPEKDIAEIDERYSGLFEKALTIEEVFKLMEDSLETYFYEYKENMKDILSYKEFLKDLKKMKEEKKTEIKVKCRKVEEDGYSTEIISSFDLILVDMYLGEEQPDGIEILNNLTEVCPEVPAFVLSISDDFEVIHKAAKAGADYYIIKNQVFSLPFVYYKYLENVGKILNCFQDESYKRNLLGNIRYWHFKKNLLWFGDKCYHMIDHSFKHTLDDWNHLNQVLVPLINKRSKKKFFKKYWDRDNDENGNDDENNKELTDELLYSFCMAIWLHDIGHKGSSHHGEPHLIRDNHGYIAGELILKYPEVFNIIDKDNYYKNFDFSDVSAVEAVYGRNRKGLTLYEMIALFAMYHKSNAPIAEESYIRLRGSHKRIPIDYYKNKEPKPENILTLEKILERRDPTIKEPFLRLTALFRFIDSIDIRAIRVGDITERELKEKVIMNDKRYQYKKLAREVKNLSHYYTKDPLKSALFVKLFYDDIIDKIENGELTSFLLSEKLIEDPEILENYKALVDYAAFIALQPGHFDLHSSVKDVQFEYTNDKHLLITLKTDRDKNWLEENQVKERGRKEQSIYERLIGDNNYIFKEIEDVEQYLKCFFSYITVRLQHETDKFPAVTKKRVLK